MINQVVLAGRLTEDPKQVGVECVELVLEVEHTPWTGPVESCAVCVRVENQKQTELALRYLKADTSVVVQGHLKVDQDQLLVASKRWEFLPQNVESRCLWEERASRPAATHAPAGVGITF